MHVIMRYNEEPEDAFAVAVGNTLVWIFLLCTCVTSFSLFLRLSAKLRNTHFGTLYFLFKGSMCSIKDLIGIV